MVLQKPFKTECLLIFFLLFLAGCSKTSPSKPVVYTFSYPLAIGNSWHYKTVLGSYDTLNIAHFDTSYQRDSVVDTATFSGFHCFKVLEIDSGPAHYLPANFFYYTDSAGNSRRFADSLGIQYSFLIMPGCPVDGYSWSIMDSIPKTDQKGQAIPGEFIVLHINNTLSGPLSLAMPGGPYDETWQIQNSVDNLPNSATTFFYHKSGTGLLKQQMNDSSRGISISKTLSSYTLK